MPRDLVLFTNAKHALALPPRERPRAILGDWLAGRGDGTHFTHFDPSRVAAVIGTAHGKVIGAYDVHHIPHELVEDEGRPGRWRVRFHGQRSAEFAHLVGHPSPVRWARGERNPSKAVGLDELRQMYAGVEPVTTDDGPARRAVIGRATVTADTAGNLTIDAPPGIAVTVRTAQAAPPSTATPDHSAHLTPRALADRALEAMLSKAEEQLTSGKAAEPIDAALGTGAMLNAAINILRSCYQQEAQRIFDQTGPGPADDADRIPAEVPR